MQRMQVFLDNEMHFVQQTNTRQKKIKTTESYFLFRGKRLKPLRSDIDKMGKVSAAVFALSVRMYDHVCAFALVWVCESYERECCVVFFDFLAILLRAFPLIFRFLLRAKPHHHIKLSAITDPYGSRFNSHGKSTFHVGMWI